MLCIASSQLVDSVHRGGAVPKRRTEGFPLKWDAPRINQGKKSRVPIKRLRPSVCARVLSPHLWLRGWHTSERKPRTSLGNAGPWFGRGCPMFQRLSLAMFPGTNHWRCSPSAAACGRANFRAQQTDSSYYARHLKRHRSHPAV